jgi:hypothetical protein
VTYETTGHKPDGDWLSIGRDPKDIHITVAGGPGKHSAFIPSFGGTHRRLHAHRPMTDWCGWPVVDESTTWENAQQILTEAELSDGLPLVPPTPEAARRP